jgi:hypothetical protein
MSIEQSFGLAPGPWSAASIPRKERGSLPRAAMTRVGFVNSVVLGICRESCWSPGGATSDRMAADRLAKAAPIFSPWSQAADENPPNGITPRRVEHLLGRELQRRRGGSSPRLIGHPEGTERSLTDALAPARIALLCPRQCESCGRHAGGNGSGFPWKSATSEFTNPTPSARMGISGAPGAGSLPDSGSRQRVHA